jgi:hypothetical protein
MVVLEKSNKMANFIYTAKDKQGTKVTGQIDSVNRAEAQQRLEGMGYIPISIVNRSAAGEGTVIATIGQKYSTSILTGEGLTETSLILTAKTLTGAGKTYSTKSRAIISFSGDVKNVSSIGTEYSSNWIMFLIGILTLPLYGLGIVFLILHFTHKERYIVVNFQGATYALTLRGVSNKDVQSFIEKTIDTTRAVSS